MIRKLFEQDREPLLSYLGEEASFNLFIIGDIENFGFEQEFQELWGQFNEQGELQAVLLRYYNSYLPYTKGNFDVEAFSQIILGNEEAEMLSGKLEVLNQFSSSLSFSNRKQLFFAELTEPQSLQSVSESAPIQQATIENCDRVFQLQESIEEFNLSQTARASFRQTIGSGTGRTYFYEEEGQVLSSASTTAENSFSAMIVGVCTLTQARNRGLASLCLNKLCHDLLSEGKTLCLFYDNPLAGAIYKRLGFQDIGHWGMFYFR
ncbi:GNAT family N-acetyltransferase [Ammoniphilus sp. YIM 78166]|uniref:GNAT family N-acetyltransferase n=1 Tax=Ammoniphilus sp. YIM 78166 TaxID=1644106 RepID=UPI00107033A0|nr:GNAT family N-acetyltransferase [Ammoniphilus sp. YIM 78166]